MKYIAKSEEPELLRDFKKVQHEAGLAATYDTFGGKGNKKTLNDILRKEQKGICCYCQRRISHFQGNKETGAHNEHLTPEHLDPGDGSIDLDYDNIFACCIVSQGNKPSSRHCGEAKGNREVAGSIRHMDCDQRFMYNLQGEILPKGPHFTWQEYLDGTNHLTPELQKLVHEIKVLNLNCNALVSGRTGVINAITQWALTVPVREVEEKLQSYQDGEEYPIFYSTIRFILSQIISRQ